MNYFLGSLEVHSSESLLYSHEGAFQQRNLSEIVTSPQADLRSASSFARMEDVTAGEISVFAERVGCQYLHQSRAPVAPAIPCRRLFLLRPLRTPLAAAKKSGRGHDAGDAKAFCLRYRTKRDTRGSGREDVRSKQLAGPPSDV